MFSLKEKNRDTLPLESTTIDAAAALIATVPHDWIPVKTFQYPGIPPVNTYRRDIAGEPWYVRVSEHKDPNDQPYELYEKFRQGLLVNHTSNEVQYIPMLQGFEQVGHHGNYENIVVHYKFPVGLANRKMAVWLLIRSLPDEFYIVQFPADTHVDGVKGMYMSVENVRLEGDTVRWTMAQTSDARGLLPRWLQNQSIAGTIAQDVQHFIEWVRDKEEEELLLEG